MSKLQSSSLEVGDIFVIDHPVYKDMAQYSLVVLKIKKAECGRVITSSFGDFHESMCRKVEG